MSRLGIAFVGLLLPILPAAGNAQAHPDSAALVTRLGTDTLVVERFVRSTGRVEAEVVLRVPRTTRIRYVLELSPTGELSRLEAATYEPRGSGEPIERQVLTRLGDSLKIEVSGGERPSTRMAAADRKTLPFLDMLHWPFELVLMRAKASGQPRVAAPLLTGARTADFGIATLASDSMTITHPTRGTMSVRVDSQGRLLALDAGATTRKLVVERRPWMALDAIAQRWAALDAAGQSVGALSGRGEVDAVVLGAAITVDYGTPSKRGREIWGALVPFGRVWRTGANAATGFTTDRDLAFEGTPPLRVPAGSYTLFSIPERTGGVLIINRETGQAGTAHDPTTDLGRVPLEMRALDSLVEVFTIAVAEEGGVGLLRLQWDRSELVARFRVGPARE